MTSGAAKKDDISGNNNLFQQVGEPQGPNTWFDSSQELYWKTDFTLTAPLPVGACFNFVASAEVSPNSNWTSGTRRDLVATISMPPGITDHAPANNWAQQGPVIFTR
ncbi:hypothetical protein [Arthrobacter sp. NPDC090010]|uniref:hypothetical protein n=1 Tax=Arthrobacter sp. NPDC090010 TaxID=3363942 RepID=UPI00382D7665